MAASVALAESSILVLIDLQPSFLSAIWEAERAVKRSEFVVRVAKELGIPIFASEQNVERMGGTHPEVAALLPSAPIGKMRFSCSGCDAFDDALAASGKKQAVLAGIETHICVSQTAHHLLQKGMEVFVCADAVSARTHDRHQIGLERMRSAGAAIAHSESAVYEWLGSADHPRFREVLKIVKSYGP